MAKYNGKVKLSVNFKPIVWLLENLNELIERINNINIDTGKIEDLENTLKTLYAYIKNVEEASKQSDKVLSDLIKSNTTFLQNQINENKIKEVKIKEDQSMIFMHPDLKSKNNSFKIKNYYVIDIDIHNTSGNEISVNSNNLLAVFDDPELLNISDEVLNDNMYVLQSYSQMLTRDVNFGKLGPSPTGIITGDSGITFPPYKTVKIIGVIKL